MRLPHSFLTPPPPISVSPPSISENNSFNENLHFKFNVSAKSFVPATVNLESSVAPLAEGPPQAGRSDARVDILDDRDAHLSLHDFMVESILSGDQFTELPPHCSCHSLPKGSCKNFQDECIAITVDLLKNKAVPNMFSLRIPLPNQTFNLPFWRFALGNYFDKNEILLALEFGWDFDFFQTPTPLDAPKNLASSNIVPAHVDIFFEAELGHGSMLGPFKAEDLPFTIFHSPLGSVEKDPVYRTITDCSQQGAGINSFIDANLHHGSYWKLSLPSTDSFVAAIKRVREKFPGRPIFMWKADFSRYYRWFLLDPGQVPFFAVKWRGSSYLDRSMAFGNRAAAQFAQRVSWSVLHTFRTKIPPHPGTFNSGLFCSCSGHCRCGDLEGDIYLDDTISVAPDFLADFQFQSFKDLCRSFGLKMSTSKNHVVPPASVCVALGMEFDLEANTVSLPLGKLTKLLNTLQDWLGKSVVTELQLASLCGRLLHAANVVRSGRLLTTRLLAAKRLAASSRSQATVVDDAVRADIKWWITALQCRNGIHFLENSMDVVLAMDASTNGWTNNLPGLGAFNFETGEYWHGPPPQAYLHLRIEDLELLCHVVCCNLWSSQWSSKHVLGKTDNKACYWLLKNGRSREDLRLRMARFVAAKQVEDDFLCYSAWLSTHENKIPDALSRWSSEKHRELFWSECSRLGLSPKKIELLDEHFYF